MSDRTFSSLFFASNGGFVGAVADRVKRLLARPAASSETRSDSSLSADPDEDRINELMEEAARWIVSRRRRAYRKLCP